MASRDRKSRGDARVLSTRALNRAVLGRQQLLQRGESTLPRMLESMAGLQAQYAPSMYIGLWSRLEGFERDHLTSALEKATVVQGTLMRATIHLVSAGDYWPFAKGIGDVRREWWLRAQRPRPHRAELEAAELKGKKVEVSRFKGLGEMNPNQLKETTMDPASRSLIRITLPAEYQDRQPVKDLVERLMGRNPEHRFAFIQASAAAVDEDAIDA